LVPGRAVAADAAVGDERADHVVARLDLGDARPDFLDDPGALVPADDREPRRQVAVGQVQVGVAEPGGDVPDQHLPGARPVQVEFHDLEWGLHVVQYRGLDLHRGPTSLFARRYSPDTGPPGIVPAGPPR